MVRPTTSTLRAVCWPGRGGIADQDWRLIVPMTSMNKVFADLPVTIFEAMSQLARDNDAINLGQGFPDWPAPADIKQKAKDAIDGDHNQYAITWGVKSFRDAIAAKTKWFLGMEIDPETEITVTCGSTEGMIAAAMAMQDAEVTPTAAAVAGATRARAESSDVMRKWTTLKSTSLAALNAKRKAAGQPVVPK